MNINGEDDAVIEDDREPKQALTPQQTATRPRQKWSVSKSSGQRYSRWSRKVPKERPLSSKGTIYYSRTTFERKNLLCCAMICQVSSELKMAEKPVFPS